MICWILSVFTPALSDRSGTVATVIFGGNHNDRRNRSLSVASLFTLQLQTDPNSPVQACSCQGLHFWQLSVLHHWWKLFVSTHARTHWSHLRPLNSVSLLFPRPEWVWGRSRWLCQQRYVLQEPDRYLHVHLFPWIHTPAQWRWLHG